jgi:hypothetical protein
MSYRWRYENSDGAEVPGPDETFEDQTEAEAWLSDTWAELLETGIDQLTLFEGDDQVYGPMSLHAPE